LENVENENFALRASTWGFMPSIHHFKKEKKKICHIIIIRYSKEMLKRDQGAPNCTCICM